MDHSKLVDRYLESGQELLVSLGGRLLGAAIILLAGFWLINRLVKLTSRIMARRELDEALRPFLITLVSISLKVVLFIPVIQLLGIATSSFLAILGSAGLAIGLALQGSLANFAGGVILLTVQPFKKGHFIKAAGESGTVHQIKIFNTILKTPDNQTVYIPNGLLAGSTIINYSDEPTRRVVMDVSIRHEEDVHKAREIIKNSLANDRRILRDPPWQIVITQLADNAVILSARVWVKNEEYWDVSFDLREKIKLDFDSAGISAPYPHAMIHLDTGAKDFLTQINKK